ncbi:hypothetical protein VTL71DRAFT_4366 [Oculimacula yallundae]|uniref:Uncharacterized protein n=1 Tax=Oculimacula yallundae TaxID=86028 RepID=A0ABR4C2W0_9HELO
MIPAIISTGASQVLYSTVFSSSGKGLGRLFCPPSLPLSLRLHDHVLFDIANLLLLLLLFVLLTLSPPTSHLPRHLFHPPTDVALVRFELI